MFVMNPEAIITKICNAIDQIMEGSKPYEGLFPSIMHPQTGDMLMEKPPKIPGQRDGDRAHLGSNLIHDEPLLATMHTLAETESHLPELANQMRQYALVYIDGFLAAPHNLETREFVGLCECETIESSSACRFGEASTVQEQRVVRRCFVSVDGD